MFSLESNFLLLDLSYLIQSCIYCRLFIKFSSMLVQVPYFLLLLRFFSFDFLQTFYTPDIYFLVVTHPIQKQQKMQIWLLQLIQFHNRQYYKFEYSITNMGVTQSNFSETLQFVQILNDIHFGQIEILKSHEAKFIMKNNKSYITGDKRYNEFKKIIDFVQTKTNPNLIPILYIEQQHQSNVCIQYQKVSIYTEYFNFTLDGLIFHKKQIQISQLWYCMKSLLDLINLLIQNNLKIQMSLDNIFLTLKGIPSIYLYHLMEEDFIRNGENVIRQSDIVESRTMFYELGKIILQLLCMEKIPEGEQEMETFFIQQLICKAEQKNILLTSFIKELLTAKYSDIISQKLQNLIKQKKIKVSNQIRFNKFKYVIPDQRNQKKNLQIKIDSQVNLAKPTQLHSIISNSYKTPLYKLQSNRTFSTQNIKQKAKTEYQQKSNIEKRLNQFESNQKSKQFFANPKIEVFDETISEKCKNENQKLQQPISIKPRKKSQSISNKSRQLMRTQSEKQEKQEKQELKDPKAQKKQIKQKQSTVSSISSMNSNNNSKLLDRMKILNILKDKQETFNISSSRNSNSNLDSNDFLSEIEKKKLENQKKMMELNMRKQMMEKGFKKSKREGFQSQDKQNKTTHNNNNQHQQPLVRHSSNSLRQSQKINPKSINFMSNLKISDKRIRSHLNSQIIPKLK